MSFCRLLDDVLSSRSNGEDGAVAVRSFDSLENCEYPVIIMNRSALMSQVDDLVSNGALLVIGKTKVRQLRCL